MHADDTGHKALCLVSRGPSAGLKATFVDTRRACVASRIHQKDDGFDHCDGCAVHPGVEGHRSIYEQAWPVISKVMSWSDVHVASCTAERNLRHAPSVLQSQGKTMYQRSVR